MKQGQASIAFQNPVHVVGMASVAGKKEGEGPLGHTFTEVDEDPMLGKDNWEAAEGECTTPTGAAILAELAGHSGRLPVMNIETVGYGFGEREFQVLNALRMFVGDC